MEKFGNKMLVQHPRPKRPVELSQPRRKSRDLRWRCGCLFIYFCRRIARSSWR